MLNIAVNFIVWNLIFAVKWIGVGAGRESIIIL